MINNIPSIIYDKEGNVIRVIKTSVVYFRNRKEMGYVFHIEQEEKITSISEYDIIKKDGRYLLTKEIFKNSLDI